MPALTTEICWSLKKIDIKNLWKRYIEIVLLTVKNMLKPLKVKYFLIIAIEEKRENEFKIMQESIEEIHNTV